MGRRRRGGLLAVSSYVRRASINRGLLGDDRFWRAVFFVMMGRRLMRKLSGAEPEIVAVERLEPGQFVRIEAIDPRTEPSVKRKKRRRRS